MSGGAIRDDGRRIVGVTTGADGPHRRPGGTLAKRLAAADKARLVRTTAKTGEAQAPDRARLPGPALDGPEAACDWAGAAFDAGG